MKKTTKWLEIWLIWIAVVLVIVIGVIKPIFTVWYDRYYSATLTERNKLYAQVDSLKNDFEAVYNMRNAEIVNSEEPIVVLKSDKFTLKVSFNQSRTEVVEIEETKQFSVGFWIIVALMVATLLYVTYSAGKLRENMRAHKSENDTKASYQM